MDSQWPLLPCCSTVSVASRCPHSWTNSGEGPIFLSDCLANVGTSRSFVATLPSHIHMASSPLAQTA
jgi:hypothetical protein